MLVKKIYRKARSVFKPKHMFKTFKSIFKRNDYILARSACLGLDIIALKFPDGKLVNQQKVRADLFLSWIDGDTRPNAEVVKQFMLREDVFPFIEQQSKLPWLTAKKSNEFIVIDSFSELTDQKFVSKSEGWSFCCHYSDLEHSGTFTNEFECHGLLNADDFELTYDRFFQFIFDTYPEKKVIFINFPTTLDNRKLYKERGEKIKAVIDKLSAKYNNVISIGLDDKQVLPHENDDFPYHFGKPTYLLFVAEINKALDGNY